MVTAQPNAGNNAVQWLVGGQLGTPRIVDALGRLVRLDEPIAGNNLGSTASPTQPTSYTYSVLGNLLTVTQGVQTRTFTYDSLSRLRTAANPESGTISYQYDDNGNLLVKTDARGVSAHYAYDALNRAGRRWYNGSSLLTSTSNNSPALPAGVGASDEVKYFYDTQTLPAGAPTFDRGDAKGRLVGVTYGGGSAGTYRGYDARGAVLRQFQQTDAVNYLTEAVYSLSGSMQSQTYPSVPGAGDSRTVSYANDNAGRLASLSSAATSYAPAVTVSGIGYSAPGGLSSETYGNNLIHAVTYNSRMQVNEIKLGTSGAPSSNVSITYNYGTTANNGNLQSTSYAGGGLNYTQTFGYDELNRLTTSQEGTSWSQTNSYDKYGNRSIVGGALGFTASNNRITGWSYDASGNLLNDGAHAYTFDAENKISKVDGVSAYVYDGDAQRVRKLVNENLRFVYGIGGQQIAEFDGTSGALKKEYVYGASGLLATIEPSAVNANDTRYTTSDHLGSPRLVTNSVAGVASRHDYMPFGEELFNGGRTFGMGYGTTDGIRPKFTAKERDNETGLDYSINRYYSSTQGRFISVDPLGASAIVSDPQSFNRYTYVLNNPLKYIDPDGLNAQNPWANLTDKERELLASKLTTVTGKGQMDAAQEAFNKLVTAGTKNDQQIMNNVASVQNFVGSLGGDSKVWNQIHSIDKATVTGNGLQSSINFTVNDHKAFIGALKETKDSAGTKRFLDMTDYVGKYDMGHPVSLRELGYGVTDPSMHVDSGSTSSKSFGGHWDPSSSLTHQTVPLFLCIACYEQDMTVAIEERLPPTFKLNGSGNLVFFSVSEVGSDNQRRIPIDRDDDNDRELWQIWPSGLSQEARVIRRLPPITYGVVPEGWVQKIPANGKPPQLVEGKIYEAGGARH